MLSDYNRKLTVFKDSTKIKTPRNITKELEKHTAKRSISNSIEDSLVGSNCRVFDLKSIDAELSKFVSMDHVDYSDINPNLKHTEGNLVVLKMLELPDYLLVNKSESLVDDLCKCTGLGDYDLHRCIENRWDPLRLLSNHPQIMSILDSLAKRLKYEMESRLKLEEKTVRIFINDLKNIELLENKNKELKGKLSNRHNSN